MKVVNIVNKKKETFKKDFRVRVFYSIGINTALEDPHIYEGLKQDGYVEVGDGFFANLETGTFVILRDNEFVLCFDKNIPDSETRISILVNTLEKLNLNNGSSIRFASVVHLNRYVISNFHDSEKERMYALKFFFRPDFASEEDIMFKGSDYLSFSHVKFESQKNENFATNLDFTITSLCLIGNGAALEEIGDKCRLLDKASYDFWRSAVTKPVIEEMKNSEEHE